MPSFANRDVFTIYIYYIHNSLHQSGTQDNKAKTVSIYNFSLKLFLRSFDLHSFRGFELSTLHAHDTISFSLNLAWVRKNKLYLVRKISHTSNFASEKNNNGSYLTNPYCCCYMYAHEQREYFMFSKFSRFIMCERIVFENGHSITSAVSDPREGKITQSK